jgi:hypothetical protein
MWMRLAFSGAYFCPKQIFHTFSRGKKTFLAFSVQLLINIAAVEGVKLSFGTKSKTLIRYRIMHFNDSINEIINDNDGY